MIIGIVGTLGAGKATVAEYLIKRHKFVYFSVRNFFAGEVVRKGLMVSASSIAKVAIELRGEHGPVWVLEQLLQQARPGQNVVIESIRTKTEVEYLKSKGALLWALDGDMRVRYQRSVNKDMSVGSISFEEFSAKDANNTASIKEALGLCDTRLHSDGTREQLYAEIDAALAKKQPKTAG